ncbi:MAG TPA: AAA family ATPase [Rubricoccaceae bacterium]|jgi:gluconokinase
MPDLSEGRPAPEIRVVVVAGVAGSGKTTVGQALARRLAAQTGAPWTFADADDYHAPEALAQMAAGHGLSEADRAPWLARLAGVVRAHLEAGPGLVLACSALRAAHRDAVTGGDSRVAVVWLDAPAGVLTARLAARLAAAPGEPGTNTVGPSLLPSQLATAEPPGADAIRLDATRPVADLADEVTTVVLGTRPGAPSFLRSPPFPAP